MSIFPLVRYLAFALLISLLAGGCAFTKDLEAHRARLIAATAEGVSLSAKRDALGESTVAMMNEAVNRLNPKKGVKYVEAYAKTNGPLLEQLVSQIKEGQRDMSQTERIAFGLSAATRPYAKDALALIPEFTKKFKQIQAVARITGGLKDVLLGKAAEKLGGLLGEAPVAPTKADDRASAASR